MSAAICGFMLGLFVGGPIGFAAAAIVVAGREGHVEWDDE